MRISVFEVMNVYPIDQYQNAIPRLMPLHELEKSLTSKCFMFMTHDSIGVSRSWHMILLVIWKPSAWVFCRWAVVLSLNGSAYSSALRKKEQNKKNTSILVWIQLHFELMLYGLGLVRAAAQDLPTSPVQIE